MASIEFGPLKAALLIGTFLLVGLAQAQPIEELRKQLQTPWTAEDWPAAEAIARQITAQPQSAPGDWRNLAGILSSQKKKAEAFAIRQELVKLAGASSNDYSGICWYLLEQNKPLEARPACQNAVELAQSKAAALGNLGHSYLLAGDKAQAQSWYQKALQHLSKDEEVTQGPLAEFELFIKNGWAVADAQASQQWFEQGWQQFKALHEILKQNTPSKVGDDSTDALPVLAKAMDDSVAQFGPDAALARVFARRHLQFAKTLAVAQVERNLDAQALQTLEASWARVGALLDKDELWGPLDELAEAYIKQAHNDNSIALRERILREQTAALGFEALITLRTANFLMVNYYAAGQVSHARDLGEKILAASINKLGADHPDTLTSMSNLASTCRKLKQYEKAVALLEALVPREVKRHGEASARVQETMVFLLLNLEALGRGPDFLLSYRPETQAAVKRLVPALKAAESQINSKRVLPAVS